MRAFWLCLAFGCLHLVVSLWQLHTGRLIDDVAFFDDALYQLSHGDLSGTTQYLRQPVLADHAAFMLYPLSLLYRLTPDLRWLLALQAAAVASGGLAVALLGRQAGLSPGRRDLAVFIYLLHPTAFNLVHDGFHPEELAIPALLVVVWAARGRRPGVFGACLLLVLSCKWLLAFTVFALGVWLAAFERRPRYGVAAMLAGSLWAAGAAFWIIPSAGMQVGRHVGRFNYLGGSWEAIVTSVLTRPEVWVPHVFSWEHLWDVACLFGPLAYLGVLALRYRIPEGAASHPFTALLVGFPAFAVAFLDGADFTSGEMTTHAPLPLQPPLMLVTVACLAALPEEVWRRHRRVLAWWSVVAFLVTSSFLRLFAPHRDPLGYRQLHEAVARIPAGARVGTQRLLFPYLPDRELGTELPIPRENLAESIGDFSRGWDAVLLDTACEPSGVARAYAVHLAARPDFQLSYEIPPVLLFVRRTAESKPR